MSWSSPLKNWNPLLIFATVIANNFKIWYTTCVFRSRLPKKQLYDQTWQEKIFGFGQSSLSEATLRTKIGEGSGLGEHPKIWDHLIISTTVVASNFKIWYTTSVWRVGSQKQL